MIPNPIFPDRSVLPQIREYLMLTEAQMSKIAQQNIEFNRFSQEKTRRMIQVQGEIGEETRREPLDPAALGIRYAELEALRREIADRNQKLIGSNMAVLTDVQKTKLKALEEAMKLVPVAQAAQASKILPDDCARGPVPTSLQIRGGDFSGTPVLQPTPVCGGGYAIGGIIGGIVGQLPPN